MVHDYDLVVCDSHGHLFELFCDHGLNPFDVIIQFIHSSEQAEFDRRTLYAASQDPNYFYYTFIEKVSIDTFPYKEGDRDNLFWAGYLMQYIGYYEEKPLKDLFDRESVTWLLDNYSVLHTQDILYVRQLLEEKYWKRTNKEQLKIKP